MATSGSFTVGSGGDYSNWAAAAAATENLTGNLTFTQISDVTDNTALDFNVALGGYTLTLTSNKRHNGNFQDGWLTTFSMELNAISAMTITNTSSSAGAKFVVDGLNIVYTGSITTYGFALRFLTNTTNIINTARNVIINANGKDLICFRYETGSLSETYNCVATNGVATGNLYADGFSLTNVNASSRFENCTAFNFTGNGRVFGFWNVSNTAITIKNFASFDAVKCFVTGASTSISNGLGNAVASKCASSDATGSEAGLINLTATDQFQSVTITDGDLFLKLKSTSILIDAGVAPSIAENTTGIRGTARPHDTNKYSIGADEWLFVVSDAIYVGNGRQINFISNGLIDYSDIYNGKILYESSTGLIYYGNDEWVQLCRYEDIELLSGYITSGYIAADLLLSGVLNTKINDFRNDWDQNGFYSRTDNTLTFDHDTRTVSIQPTDTSFSYLLSGVPYSSTGDTFEISDVTGLHAVYYVGSTISETVNPTKSQFSNIMLNKTWITSIYWNAITSSGLYVGEERHGKSMSPATHDYEHFNEGLRYNFGLSPLSVNPDEDGDDDFHAQFGIDAGAVTDEDIYLPIDAIASGVGLPIYYLTGADVCNKAINPGFSVMTASGVGETLLGYNQWTGSEWKITELGNLDFVLCHVFATTDITTPIISIMGQNEYTTLGNARDGAEVEVNALVTEYLPLPEMRPIATFIFQTANGYDNAVKARIRTTDSGDDYIDWRDVTITRSVVSSTNHGSLSGLGSDDHLQYLTDLRASGLFYGKSDIDYKIVNASGAAVITASGIANGLDNVLSGYFISRENNLSGTLVNYTNQQINTYSGFVGTTYATKVELGNASGVLNTKIDTISGVIVTTASGIADGLYLKKDGSTPLIGDWYAGSNNITISGNVGVGINAADIIATKMEVTNSAGINNFVVSSYGIGTTHCGSLVLMHSRSNTIGELLPTENGDNIGRIRAYSVGSTSGVSEVANIRFDQVGAANERNGGCVYIQTREAGTDTNLTTKFYVSPSGDIGINNIIPVSKLDVSGVITASGGNSSLWNTSYGWGDWHTPLANASGVLNSKIDSVSGTLNNKIWASGSIVTAIANASGSAVNSASGIADGLYLQKNGSTPLTANWYTGPNNIYTSGSIGIGTTSPTALLQLQGDDNNIFLLNTDSVNDGKTCGLFTGHTKSGSHYQSYYGNISGVARYMSIGGLVYYAATPTPGVASLRENSKITIDLAGIGGVGIGAYPPVSKLDVSGVITASGGNSSIWNAKPSYDANYFIKASGIIFGDDIDGTWLIKPSGNNLSFERKESGTWVVKGTMLP